MVTSSCSAQCAQKVAGSREYAAKRTFISFDTPLNFRMPKRHLP